MKNKQIRLIIFLASISLAGVLINQIFWVNKEILIQKKQIETQQKNLELEKAHFENLVTLSLVNVRDKLISLNDELTELYLEPVQQITPNYFVVSFYDTLNPIILENLIVEQFNQYNVQQKFEYGIYDCFADSIIFDRYVDLSSSKKMSGKSTNPATFKWDHDGHYFGVFFPDKKEIGTIQSLEMSESLVISTLVIFIVFLILSYSITIILKQKKLSEIKNDFINNMTHELKTPISTISISSEVLLSQSISEHPKKISEYAAIIKQENKRLELLVEKVLQTAQLSESEFTLQKEEGNIHEIIQKCVQSFGIIINTANGSLKTNFQATDPIIRMDKTHLINVISNLIDNAVKYSSNAPSIVIYSSNIDNGIKVIVEDKGKGMSKEECKLIFDQFYRVPTGSVHDVKGFGIGLFYVKRILSKHGGKIEVKSEINKGTKMIFWLPK
ncbi:MAG: HAMP domain-containing sensor histidine kinase [Bacteroidota bacterium]|nr:HAMP domain-containing sensor histidine kinase [Bacteroidota bacterium]